MKYVPPYGQPDDAPYINGDPSIGRQGSIPPAAMMEHPQREIVNVISFSQIAPSDTDLRQLTQAIRSQRLNYVLDTGNENNISVALDPPLTSYTPGLVLHVLMSQKNTGPVRINVNGLGNRQVVKPNGADLQDNDLPQGSIAGMIFDNTGTRFQLLNFGGAAPSGAPDIFKVNIPYAVDTSTVANDVHANFPGPPPILPTNLVAGDVIAIKFNTTNEGPIRLYLSGSLTPIELKPNGGGPNGFALQGDIHEGDILILFYDGANFWFTPNPEIDAPVTYKIGTGLNFDTIADAMQALKRKTIGAKGFVELLYPRGTAGSPNVIEGPISVSHPSADRLRVAGEMLPGYTTLAPSNFFRSGTSAALIQQDSTSNLAMLRNAYGVEVRVPANGIGLTNEGPGRVEFRNLLVVDPSRPNNIQATVGVNVTPGYTASLFNVTVWGAYVGFRFYGEMIVERCHACACTGSGFTGAGAALFGQWCGSYGNAHYGFFAQSGTLQLNRAHAQSNAVSAVGASHGGSGIIWFSAAFGSGSGVDIVVTYGSTITYVRPGTYGNRSPAPDHTTGNFNSIISVLDGTPTLPAW